MKKSLLLLLILIFSGLIIISCDFDEEHSSVNTPETTLEEELKDFTFSFNQGQFNREELKQAIKDIVNKVASNNENVIISLYNVYMSNSGTPLTDDAINKLLKGTYDINLTLQVDKPDGSSSLPFFKIKFIVK